MYVVCPHCGFRQRAADSWKTYTCKRCRHRNSIIRTPGTGRTPSKAFRPTVPVPPPMPGRAAPPVTRGSSGAPSRRRGGRRVGWWILGFTGIVVVIAALSRAGSSDRPAAEEAGGLARASSAPAPHAPTTSPDSPKLPSTKPTGHPTPTRSEVRHSPHAKVERPAVACPAKALLGVYHPDRLVVLGSCRWYSGIVTDVRREPDGDYHVDVAPDRGDARYLNGGNARQQSGSLVTEIMPGQHFSLPSVGDHVAVFGTWVYDSDHGWDEIHPIWAIQYGSGGVVRSLPPATPRFGGEGGRPSPSPRTSPSGSSSNCTPGYSPCLPEGPSDYDCYGGSGNGPAYTEPGVTYRVTGPDPYGLDADGDGLGCE
jgi:hypothetical protein